MTDVCIIGAGPAGVSAAAELLSAGARVVLIDRHGRPGGKACGGGITRSAWDIAGVSPAQYTARTDLQVFSPYGQTHIQTPEPYMVVVDRQEWLGERIAQLAKGGCDVRTGVRFRHFSDGVVATDKGTIPCDILIGADGAASRVRRQLGLDSAVSIVARQIVLPEGSDGARRLLERSPAVWFNYERFGAGYGWAFPHGEEIRLGCGTANATHLKRAFFSWLKELSVDPAEGRLEAASIGCRYAGHRFGRVYLAGDAAGVASPVTGEGIGQALVSGKEVAREIIDGAYRSEEMSALGMRHRRTFEVLLQPVLGRLLLDSSPVLLKSGWLQHKAMGRFS